MLRQSKAVIAGAAAVLSTSCEKSDSPVDAALAQSMTAIDYIICASAKSTKKSMPLQTNKDKVKQQILNNVFKGRYSPGQRLREVVLAKELNTSIILVREALRELESMRILEPEPYKGVRVRKLTVRDIQEAYEVRAVLEAFAGGKAALKLKGEVETLHKYLDSMIEAAAKGDIEAYTQADLPFHRCIVQTVENVPLLKTWDSLDFEIRTGMYLAAKSHDLKRSVFTHVAILEALKNGNSSEAARLLKEHSLSFATDLEDQVVFQS